MKKHRIDGLVWKVLFYAALAFVLYFLRDVIIFMLQ